MNDQPTLDLQNSESDDSLNLATYAQRAYLEYALSVVKGRALPDVCDGQKTSPAAHFVFHVSHGFGLFGRYGCQAG